MDDYIAISTLNDFIFCPYSIYLHNVYMETDEGVYHATPQTRGRIAHETVDEKRTSNRRDELQALPVISHTYGLTGKIDIYRGREKKNIERKYQLKNIYQGQMFFDALVPYKQEIFKYVQSYYRCFMGGKDKTRRPSQASCPAAGLVVL